MIYHFRVLSLVFLFIVRLRFRSGKSIASVIRSRYNNGIVKQIRGFEKLDFKIRKNEADLDFLQSCQQNNLIPKFLNFKVASSSLQFSRTYKQCQKRLLKQEIKEKVSIISKQKKEFTALKKFIEKKLSIIDFAHICCLFLVGNDKKITKVKEAHCKKLKKLGLVSPLRSHNLDKIIINHSSYQLSDIEKTVLAKGLNFALPPKKLNYADYLTPYKLLFRDIKELSVDDSILERVKVDMKKICLSSFENFKFKDESNITPDELKALKDLSSRKDIIIQKADKGNSVVILNKRDYIERMTEMLSDIDKFKKLNVKPGKELNLLLKHEDKLVSFLKGIKKSIGEDLYKGLYPQGSQPGIMGHLKYINLLLMAFLNLDLFCLLSTQVLINGQNFLFLYYDI